MARLKIIFFSAVVVPLLVVAVTVALAFVWSNTGDKSALFWVNLTYGVVLELVFFGWLAVVRWSWRAFTGAFYSIMGVWAIYYIMGGVILLLFSLLIPLKLYVTLITVLTLLWLVVGALVAETDSRHKADVETTKEKNKKLMKKE